MIMNIRKNLKKKQKLFEENGKEFSELLNSKYKNKRCNTIDPHE